MKRIFPAFLFVVLLGSCLQPDSTEGVASALFKEVPSAQTGITFVNQLRETDQQNFLRYPYFYNGGGVALGDINDDGLQDVYFTGNMVGDHLYVNKGDLQFEEITQKAGILKANLWTTGVTMADVNNDGKLDIYVCRSGMGSFRDNLLYINQGNEKFIEQAQAYGLNDEGNSVQANFFDYDLDGDLDLYVVNHSVKFFTGQEQLFEARGNPDPSEADRLYRNNGVSPGSSQVVFEDVSANAGINHFAFGLSASIADVNQDGWPDIYVASDFFEPDFLYINQGNGRFENKIDEMMGHTSFSSMGSDISDFNNDGFPDLMVCDMQSADNYRKKANMASMDTDRFARMVAEGYHFQYMQNTLQLNSGVGRFSEVAEMAGVAETDWSWGPLFFDLDNDGWKDLFISNGIRRDIQYKDILNDIGKKVYDPSRIKAMDLIEKFPVNKLSNYTYRNQGNLTFNDHSDEWGIQFEGFSTGAAYGDLDNDGDLDLVLNNLDDAACVYENLSEGNKANHFIEVNLKGQADNHFGLGSTIMLHCGGEVQHQYVQSTRGFQSAVAPAAHFGLGSHSVVDKIEVHWPDGSITKLEEVAGNQHITIMQQNGTAAITSPQEQPLFTEVTKTAGIDFTHREVPYDDFASEVLLPHTYSQLGPAMAVGDVNGDKLDDLYIGGAHDQSGSLFVQRPEGGFRQTSQTIWKRDKGYEDIDAIFFDADGDQDLDLYVVSGSNEWTPGDMQYSDRLYLNEGLGQFERSNQSLPEIRTSGSCVRAGDFDGDGDSDLFVGGRAIPGSYPVAESSHFLENHNGIFSDVTENVIGSAFKPGLVTDAQWLDIDNDKDLDLAIVGEWMPIFILQNNSGSFERMESTGLQNSNGWWYSLEAEDMDQDGDIDLVAGNLGLNYKYKASVTEPFQVYAADFDENGALDIVLGYFDDGELFPLRGRQCSAEQMPSLSSKYENYSTFASATLADVYGSVALDQALHLEAHSFASSYVENLGEGEFKIHALPVMAQLSAVNGIVVEDLNADQHLDLILAGNMFGSEVETARNDAGLGLILLGTGDGNYTTVPPSQSGLLAHGDVKSLAKIEIGNGETVFIIGNNNDKVGAWKNTGNLQK